MYRQMDIFDYIDKAPEEPPQRTLFERLFYKIKDPVLLCANCLCNYCTCNIEAPRDRVKPEESRVAEPCFNCDECRQYTGTQSYEFCCREDCDNFIMSDYGAKQNRKRFTIVKGL